MNKRAIPTAERGAALLTVLLLVAVMAVISAVAMERLTLATRLSANGVALDQARAYALAAESYAAVRIDDLSRADNDRTTLVGGWQGRPQNLPIPAGRATVRAFDGGNCFNLNSVVAGDDPMQLTIRPIGVKQFTTLAQLVGVPARDAQLIGAALADWIDTDAVPQPGGAEDESYVQMKAPYRTANGMMSDASELRSVRGVTPEIYTALQPWICALPVTDLSPINVNTLPPERAVLFAMLLSGKVTVNQARQLLAQRPADGYGSTTAFWALPALSGMTPDAEAAEQTVVKTRWFRVEVDIELGGTQMSETALFDAKSNPVRLVRRNWGFEG